MAGRLQGLGSTVLRADLRPQRPLSNARLLAAALNRARSLEAQRLTPAERQLAATRAARREKAASG